MSQRLNFQDLNESDLIDLTYDLYWNLREIAETEEEKFHYFIQTGTFKDSADLVSQKKNIDEKLTSIKDELKKHYNITIVKKEDATEDLAPAEESIKGKEKTSSFDDIQEKIELVDANDVEIDQIIVSLPLHLRNLPRLRFLLARRRYLQLLKPHIYSQSEPKTMGLFNSALNVSFNAGKKMIDATDDSWQALRNSSALKNAISPDLFNILNPLLIATPGGIIIFTEGFLGFKRMVKAYRKRDTIGQPKTRIAANAGVLILALGGTGVAAALFATAFGAAVLGAATMPAILTATLLTIYSTILLRKSYSLHVAIRNERKAQQEYENCYLSTRKKLDSLTKKINKHQDTRKKLHEKIKPILIKLKEKPDINILQKDERETYLKYLLTNTKLIQFDREFHDLQVQLERARKKYEEARENRLNKERKVGFNTAEVIASTIVLAGVVLGSAAFFGAAGVATFGAAPLALIVTGVVVGFAIKVFEHIDNKYDHKFSNGIRNFFVNSWNKVTNPLARGLKKVILSSPQREVNESHSPNTSFNTTGIRNTTHIRNSFGSPSNVGSYSPSPSSKVNYSLGGRQQVGFLTPQLGRNATIDNRPTLERGYSR